MISNSFISFWKCRGNLIKDVKTLTNLQIVLLFTGSQSMVKSRVYTWSSLSTSLMSTSLLAFLRSLSSMSSMLEENDGSSSELVMLSCWLLDKVMLLPLLYFITLMLLLSVKLLRFPGIGLSWMTSNIFCLEAALSGVSVSA